MSTRSTEKLPALDEDAITDLEHGLPGGDLSPALHTFREELEKRAEVLERLNGGEDHSSLAALAHGLKGSASTFCAPGLASAALSVEEELVARDAERIHAATLELAAELKRVITHLRVFLERRKTERE